MLVGGHRAGQRRRRRGQAQSMDQASVDIGDECDWAPLMDGA